METPWELIEYDWTLDGWALFVYERRNAEGKREYREEQRRQTRWVVRDKSLAS